jgi:hypothetical protein
MKKSTIYYPLFLLLVWAMGSLTSYGTKHSINENDPFINTPSPNFYAGDTIQRTGTGSFTIPQYITVTLPNGSENWLQGSTYGITWSDNLPGNVKIDLYLNGVFESNITPSTPSTGSYSWTIPASQPPSSFYKIRITDISNGTTTDSSDARFSITGTVPLTRTVQNVTIYNGQSFCYDATQTVTIGGFPVLLPGQSLKVASFLVLTGGSVTIIAGESIRMIEGTVILPGGYLHGYIAPIGPFCPSPPAESAVSVENAKGTVAKEDPSQILLWPNPTSGEFWIDLYPGDEYTSFYVEIFGMTGNKILSEKVPAERNHLISLSSCPSGLYFVHVIAEGRNWTKKLIKE